VQDKLGYCSSRQLWWILLLFGPMVSELCVRGILICSAKLADSDLKCCYLPVEERKFLKGKATNHYFTVPYVCRTFSMNDTE
jgi:hypothetical protein